MPISQSGVKAPDRQLTKSRRMAKNKVSSRKDAGTKTVRKAAGSKPASPSRKSSGSSKRPSARKDTVGKHLVIVESPTKAKTINKYLGSDYVVMASVGHVRDLPSRNPKGVKAPVPGVDLDNSFAPTYEVLPAKQKTVTELKKAAKDAGDVWFATDLDREGEAIAWHIAETLGQPVRGAKRVVFNAITEREIRLAFSNPRPIDENRVNAQQARRILDRIVGYQVSPFLWKKVAGGLSAGRVQSVAVRFVVEREREIEGFEPREHWKVTGYFTPDLSNGFALSQQWLEWLTEGSEANGKPRAVREKSAWLNEHQCVRGELVEVASEPFKAANRDQALDAVGQLGFVVDQAHEHNDPKGRGPAADVIRFDGHLDDPPDFSIESITTKAVSSRPSSPFITSTMQQAGSNQLGFSLFRTMRVAQQLYEGVDIHGAEGQTGLITYMRTDATHLSGEALEMVRSFITEEYGNSYLPDKPNIYSSAKSAQEAHEAIRPTDVRITPKRVQKDLTQEQFKLYRLIWERFVACQMRPAKWDSTTILIGAQAGGGSATAVFKVTGRTLVFDGFYRIMGLPSDGVEPILPSFEEGQTLRPIQIDPTQHFTAPPPRYTEATLQKKMEEEGIGRPPTYAPIIQTIQDRKYVMPVAPRERRLMATDLGKVVTDMLTEAFPKVMDVSYTRHMEEELDKIEEEDQDWVTMLRDFYRPFKTNLESAHEQMVHAKAVTEPAPHECGKCQAKTEYRFGRNGRFLSCTRYPDCDYAAPIDSDGNPMDPQISDILCPLCQGEMYKRVGRFGPFLGCTDYPKCKGIVNLDPKKQTLKLPKVSPLQIDLSCPKCDSPLNLRRSKRGPWLSCSKFPKCRGRMAWSAVEQPKQETLEHALTEHEQANPQPLIRNTSGNVVGEDYIPKIMGETDEPVDDQESIFDSDAA